MKNILLFIAGFISVWLLGSFVVFTFDYSTLEPIDRFMFVSLSVIGGFTTVILGNLP